VPEQVVTTYGMTETGSGCVYAGRPLPGVEILIGDGTLGGLGEILVRGPMLLRCYRDGSDPRLPGGWLPTGDGGHLGVDGNLVVHGRLADVIVTGGEKVWPAAVESVVSRHPSVAEVAVWKRPDPEWGERVVAWVVPRPGSDVPTTAELRDLIAGDLGAWHAPKEVVAMTALPRTAGGKVRRFDLT
jgi:O-succinylbenzoic acid--CoA ligase